MEGGAAPRTAGADRRTGDTTPAAKPGTNINTTRPITPSIDLTGGNTDPAGAEVAAAGTSKPKKKSRKEKDTTDLPRITRASRKDVNYAE